MLIVITGENINVKTLYKMMKVVWNRIAKNQEYLINTI